MMALEIMKENVQIIQALSDYPNQEEGLTAGEMKAKFDEAAVLLQRYINERLVPAVNEKVEKALLDSAVADGVSKALETEAAELAAAAAALIPKDGALSPTSENPVQNKVLYAALAGKLPAVESTEYPGCYYRTVNGTSEWLNPPMVIGTEYRTTERYSGKAVYEKAVSLGNLPNAATKQVRYTASGVVATNIVNIRGIAMNESGRPQPLPLDYNGLLIEIHANAEFVFVRTIDDNSTWTAVAVVKYTKD